MKPLLCLIAILIPTAICGWLEAGYQRRMRQQCEAGRFHDSLVEPARVVRHQAEMAEAHRWEPTIEQMADEIAALQSVARACAVGD